MAALREVIEKQGLFCALYSDRGSHFFVTIKAGEKVDKSRFAQVGRALKELGIQMIPAYSPQARGRSERNFGTWQGRLPQELRLAGIVDLAGANRFLRERYIAGFNRKFAVAAAEKGTAFRRCGRSDLEWIFSVQTERVAAKDNTVAIGERRWQLEKTGFRHTLAGCTITIHEHPDGIVSMRYGPHVVGRFDAQGEPLERGGKPGARRVPRGNSPAAARNLNRPLSRFPLRGKTGGTAASAALRLGQCTGPKQNARPRSEPVRKKALASGAAPPNPASPK